MSRIVLLHLSDSQVDLLTLARSREPEKELLVVHPSENALIRRLAHIAEVVTKETPPTTKPGDVVVSADESEVQLLEPWVKAGARIMSPEAFVRGDVATATPDAPPPIVAIKPPAPVKTPPPVHAGTAPKPPRDRLAN